MDKETEYQKQIDELQRYTNLANDENGDYCQGLLNFISLRDCCMTDTLYGVLMAEVQHWLKFFQDNFDIEPKERTKVDKWEELVYKM